MMMIRSQTCEPKNKPSQNVFMYILFNLHTKLIYSSITKGY